MSKLSAGADDALDGAGDAAAGRLGIVLEEAGAGVGGVEVEREP